jgi:aspartate/methionine/tyrosine aminotransferase
MFSDRVPAELATNRLTARLAAARAQGRPLLDLTVTNPTRAGFEYPADLFGPLADPHALRYDPRPLGRIDAREAVARDYARQGVRVDADRVVLTASTSEAYSLLFKLLADAGDEVLVPRPSYPLFEHLTRLDLVTAIPYHLEYHGAWSIDLSSVERAITPRTRALLIVSPNNPTGSFVAREELDRIASLCRTRDIAIIADEVFADYELEPGALAAAGRAATRGDVLTFSLGGLSKSAGLPQVKLGWIAVSGPDALAAAAIDRLELVCDTYLSVSTPVQAAAACLVDAGAGIRAQIAARTSANYQYLRQAVTAAGACRLLRSDAGWSAVLQVPTLQSEEDLVLHLLDHEGVLAQPGYFYDFPRESFVVVSLLTPPAVLADGIRRLLRHFDCSVVNP